MSQLQVKSQRIQPQEIQKNQIQKKKLKSLNLQDPQYKLDENNISKIFLKTIAGDQKKGKMKMNKQPVSQSQTNFKFNSKISLDPIKKNQTCQSLDKSDQISDSSKDKYCKTDRPKLYKTFQNSSDWSQTENSQKETKQKSQNLTNYFNTTTFIKLKHQSKLIKNDFYKSNDPLFQYLKSFKKYKPRDIPNESFSKYQNLYSLLLNDEQNEVNDIQYVSYQQDILDHNKIIPVIHEEYQEVLNDEVIQNINHYRLKLDCNINDQSIDEGFKNQTDQFEQFDKEYENKKKLKKINIKQFNYNKQNK